MDNRNAGEGNQTGASKLPICGKCKSIEITVEEEESSCGGFDDTKYTCRSCGNVVWIEGADA